MTPVIGRPIGGGWNSIKDYISELSLFVNQNPERINL
jgi:hypothetical protein